MVLDLSLAVLSEQGIHPLGKDSFGDNQSFLQHSEHNRDAGLRPRAVWHNPGTAKLYEHALLFEPEAQLCSNGALVVHSGGRTGRSPSDKRLVKEPVYQDEVWWGEGSPNMPTDTRAFLANRQTAVDYLNMQDRVYVVDGFAGWDASCQMKVRAICSSACHALMLSNMLVPAGPCQLAGFGEPDFVVYHVGAFPANKYESYMTSSTSISTSLTHKEIVILGTQYAGESKKGIWTLMHYHLPVPDVLFLHSGCNVGGRGDVTLFLGLSGTGKTTLSFDPKRALVGDDEHCWGPAGVFNIEGGCYAKVIGLTSSSPPGIHQAIRFGAVLENVVIDPNTAQPDFNNSSITENIRASFPMAHVPFARVPGVAAHPSNIILLTCDAFGVLPPVSKLRHDQALYHFISGYTAKVAGTEQGVNAPTATFSACFAGAFLLWHPLRYASLLADKMQQHGTQAWLVNTGWVGGSCGGSGQRISLQHTRGIIDAIHSGQLQEAAYVDTPYFNLQVPTSCPGVPSGLLQPHLQWHNTADYNKTLAHLAQLFSDNFDSLVASSLSSSCDSRSRQLAQTGLMRMIAAGGPKCPSTGAAAAAAALPAAAGHTSSCNSRSRELALTGLMPGIAAGGPHCQPPPAAPAPTAAAGGTLAQALLAGAQVATAQAPPAASPCTSSSVQDGGTTGNGTLSGSCGSRGEAPCWTGLLTTMSAAEVHSKKGYAAAATAAQVSNAADISAPDTPR